MDTHSLVKKMEMAKSLFIEIIKRV